MLPNTQFPTGLKVNKRVIRLIPFGHSWKYHPCVFFCCLFVYFETVIFSKMFSLWVLLRYTFTVVRLDCIRPTRNAFPLCVIFKTFDTDLETLLFHDRKKLWYKMFLKRRFVALIVDVFVVGSYFCYPYSILLEFLS